MTQRRSRFATILIFIFFIPVFFLDAGEINFKGMVQAWFSYADRQDDSGGAYGFTLRRIRLKPYGSFSKSIKWLLQVGWDKQTAILVDAYIDFQFADECKVRIGKFPVPGAISGTLTSTGKLDFIERAVITDNWGDNSALSQHRGVGVQVDGHLLDNKVVYAVMMANPKTTALFSPGIKSPGYSHEDNGLTLWARAETKFVDGFRLGAFYGGGKTTDSDYRRISYGTHLFYIKGPINFKIEYIAGEYGIEGAETKYNGMYAVFGYKFAKFEPIIRYGIYTPGNGHPDDAGVEKYKDITLGLNYYFSENIKFQVNAVSRREQGAELKNNLFCIHLQYVF